VAQETEVFSREYLSLVLLLLLLSAAVELPLLIRARFPRLYRGPLAVVGDRIDRQNYAFRLRIAGLMTAFASVALLRWLWPDWFGGRGLSLPAAAIFSLVIYLSFWVWRFGIRTPRLRA
jgi:hypothetical protein